MFKNLSRKVQESLTKPSIIPENPMLYWLKIDSQADFDYTYGISAGPGPDADKGE